MKVLVLLVALGVIAGTMLVPAAHDLAAEVAPPGTVEVNEDSEPDVDLRRGALVPASRPPAATPATPIADPTPGPTLEPPVPPPQA
jgi:hypothetical protein